MSQETAEKLGALNGRLEALEKRVDRHEDSLDGRLGTIETKIDALSTQLAMQRGGMGILHWIWPFAGGLLSGWFAKHFA